MLQLQSTSLLILGIWRACCASSVVEQNAGSLGCQTASRSAEFAETEDEGGGGREVNTKIERGISTHADRKGVNQIEAAEGGEGKEMSKISRGPGILMISTRGSVIAGSLKSRASDDQVRTSRRERGCKNVRCTCLYLFCIISAALPRVSPTGFTAGLISFPLFRDLPRRDSLLFGEISSRSA